MDIIPTKYTLMMDELATRNLRRILMSVVDPQPNLRDIEELQVLSREFVKHIDRVLYNAPEGL